MNLNSYKKNLVNVLFLIVCLGYSNLHAQETRGIYVCLVDISASESEEDFDQYVDIITNEIVTNLNKSDYIVIYPIDAGANTKPQKIVEMDLDMKSFSKDSDGFTHAQDSVEKRLQIFLDSKRNDISNNLIKIKKERSENILKTDIFGAINQASMIFNQYLKQNDSNAFLSYLKGEKNVNYSSAALFIFSDMINDNRFGNFKQDDLSGQSIIKKITTSYNSNLTLNGVDVLVYGRRAKSSDRVEHIKSFWQRFFTTVGADLETYGYDTASQMESYLKKKDNKVTSIEYEADSKEKTGSAYINPQELIGGYVGKYSNKKDHTIVIIDIRKIKSTADNIEVYFDINYGSKSKLDNIGYIQKNNWGVIQLENKRKLFYQRNQKNKITLDLQKNGNTQYILTKVDE